MNHNETTMEKLATAVDDTIITAKAKAELLATDDLKSLQISVETNEGNVVLSGSVENIAFKSTVEFIVSKIEGVKSIKNDLLVSA